MLGLAAAACITRENVPRPCWESSPSSTCLYKMELMRTEHREALIQIGRELTIRKAAALLLRRC